MPTRTLQFLYSVVDHCEQNTSLHRVFIRGKIYIPITEHFIDVFEQNAWQLYKKTVSPGNMDHLTFRRCRALAFLQSNQPATPTSIQFADWESLCLC